MKPFDYTVETTRDFDEVVAAIEAEGFWGASCPRC